MKLLYFVFLILRYYLMTDPTITCPSCKTEIKLNESLAAPLVESTKKDYEQRLAKKDSDIATKELGLRKREEELSKAKDSVDAQIAEKLQAERAKIIAEEGKKAKLLLASEIDQKAKEIADIQAVLKDRDIKLAEAQKTQADLIRKSRELDDAKRELDLTVEKKIQEGLSNARDQAKKEVEDVLKLKVSEKEQVIAGMQKQIEELKRRAEQGSQQLQGEVQELELESLLKAKFPVDIIEPVAKGEFGGDAIQTISGPLGSPSGKILWESKRTKNWSDGWLVKLREDQRAAKAECAVIVSQVLPKGVDDFAPIDGVWVVHPRSAISLALALRHGLIEVSLARQASAGQETKMELVYQYLTGPRFRLRIEAIVEAFSSMKEDLIKEKKVIQAQWAKREIQIERVMQSTVGMYGDLQGIAGKSLQEIEGLSLAALEEPQITLNQD